MIDPSNVRSPTALVVDNHQRRKPIVEKTREQYLAEAQKQRDKSYIAWCKEHHHAGTLDMTVACYRAMAVKVSKELLLRMMGHWVLYDNYHPVGMPYMVHLLALGYTRDELMQLVEQRCFGSDDRGDNLPSNSDHRRAFIADPFALEILAQGRKNEAEIADFLRRIQDAEAAEKSDSASNEETEIEWHDDLWNLEDEDT